jgi:hypothetical protein
MLGVPLRTVVNRAHTHAAVGPALLVVDAARGLGEQQPCLDEVLLGRQMVGSPKPDGGRALLVERLLQAVRDGVQRLVPACILEVSALVLADLRLQQPLARLRQGMIAVGIDGESVCAPTWRVIASVHDAVLVRDDGNE